MSEIDRSKVTFSQAEGLEPLPGPLKLKDLPSAARARIWTIIYAFILEYRDVENFKYVVRPPASNVYFDWCVYQKNEPANKVTNRFEDIVARWENFIFGGEYNEALDLIQYILRHDQTPYQMVELIDEALLEGNAAYTVTGDPPTIYPRATEEEGRAIQISISTLGDSGFVGAQAHLRRSAEEISQQAWANSIRESIHAVESVARALSGKDKAALKDATKSLEEQGLTMHPAFREAISKLYGYTSDEDGIRHSSAIDESKADMADAVFMLGACASFCTFLVQKARALGIEAP